MHPDRLRPTNPPPRHAVGAAAILVLFTLVLYGAPVPRLSEELYLPLVRHAGDGHYLGLDWTLRGPFTEHWVFDHAFGWLAAALPLPLFGWIGRLVSWSVLAWLLVKLGTRLGASVTAAAVGIGLWLFANQAFMGGDWMLGTFEAKTVGYCFLVAALIAAVDRRLPAAMVLLGATVSFHPGVGLWAGIGLGLTLVALRETRAAALRWAPVGAVVALPGIIGGAMAAGHQTAALSRFLVIEAVPQHTDPFFDGARFVGPQIVLHVVVLAGMFGANWWWSHRTPARFAPRVLLGVQGITLVAVAAAFVARALHWWSFLLLSPLRVGPLLVPLVFFVNLMQEVDLRRATEPGIQWWRRRSVHLAVLGLVVATIVTAPVIAGPRMVSRTIAAWTNADNELDAFHWIRDHTPASTRCLVPVDRQDAFMATERAVVVNWQAIRYDDVAGWQHRVFALVGGPRYFFDGASPGRIAGRRGGDLESLRGAYNALSRNQIVSIAQRYHATCIVATTSYRLPVVDRVGAARVYRTP